MVAVLPLEGVEVLPRVDVFDGVLFVLLVEGDVLLALLLYEPVPLVLPELDEPVALPLMLPEALYEPLVLPLLVLLEDGYVLLVLLDEEDGDELELY